MNTVFMEFFMMINRELTRTKKAFSKERFFISLTQETMLKNTCL